MKKKLQLFIILISFGLFNTLHAQPSWIYTEQNSGVTTSLNSASVSGDYQLTQVWVCGSGGVVLKSTNLGNNWVSAGNGIPNTVNLISISSKAVDTVLTAGNNGTTTHVYRTTNGGANWTQVFTQNNGHINAVWMRSALNAFITGNPVGGRWSMWKTTNGGITWDSTGMRIPQNGTETGWHNSLAVMYNNIWFGTNNSRIYKSTNLGLNFTFISTPEQNSSAVWMYRDTFLYVFAYSGGNNIYATTTGGTNWTPVVCPDTGKFRGFCPGYLGVDNSQPPMASYAVRNNNKVYFCYSPWGQFNAEYTAPSGIYNHMAYDVNVSYWLYTWAVRSNGGITRISLFRGGAVKKISTEIPDKFNLSQNYPNPFNPSTKIKIEIPPSKGARGMTHLFIYDILGREVTTLVNEQLSPGTYEVEWNASNYPSGVYFYKLITADASASLSIKYTETRKMVLIK
jgi:photosystem II stability/assembly factor-like uncharacterized protein